METRLTQRILGIIVIIALAFIAISLWLRNSQVDKPKSTLSNMISREKVLTEAKIQASDTLPGEEQQPTEVVQPTALNAETTQDIAQSPAPVSATHSWVVQLGSFSQAQNAAKLIQKLKTQGVVAFSRDHMINGHPVINVFVGPISDHHQALTLQEKLAKTTKLQGIIKLWDPSYQTS